MRARSMASGPTSTAAGFRGRGRSISRRAVTAPAANNALTPDAALVARFREDIAALCDPANTNVLLAVSGGADSTALLLLAHAALGGRRSEEHTSELQSLMSNSYAGFCLKKKHIQNSTIHNTH